MLIIKKQFPNQMTYTYAAIGIMVFILTIVMLRVVNASGDRTVSYESSQVQEQDQNASKSTPDPVAQQSDDQEKPAIVAASSTKQTTTKPNQIATSTQKKATTAASSPAPASVATQPTTGTATPEQPTVPAAQNEQPAETTLPANPETEPEEDSSLLGNILSPVLGLVDAIL